MCAVVSKQHENGNYTLIGDTEDNQLGYFDNPLPCFGCGIGWFCLLLGFVLPLMWYYATILYFGNYYRKDPRERTGLAASAIATGPCHWGFSWLLSSGPHGMVLVNVRLICALIFTVAVLIAIIVIVL